MWSVNPNCTVISILWEVYLNASTGGAVSLAWMQHQLCLFIDSFISWFFFWDQNSAFGWYRLARFWSLFLFRRLFHLPTWSDTISSGSVSPHLKPFRVPTECLLANVSLFLSAQSPRSPDTYSPHPAESARHTEFDTHTKKNFQKLHMHSFRCSYVDIEPQTHSDTIICTHTAMTYWCLSSFGG